MNRCKDCKYFERNSGVNYSDKYGSCNCEKFVYGGSEDERLAYEESCSLSARSIACISLC